MNFFLAKSEQSGQVRLFWDLEKRAGLGLPGDRVRQELVEQLPTSFHTQEWFVVDVLVSRSLSDIPEMLNALEMLDGINGHPKGQGMLIGLISELIERTSKATLHKW